MSIKKHILSVLALLCILAESHMAQAFNGISAGISYDYVKDVNENVIYAAPFDMTDFPKINYVDIGYFIGFKPVNMLSTSDIIDFKRNTSVNIRTNRPLQTPSTYNISFENGGEVQFQANAATLEELVKKNPGKPEYIYALACKLKNEGDYTRALLEVDKALKLNYNYALGHFLKADILRKTGNFKEAAKEYSKTLEINPYCTDAYFNIAKMLEVSGNIDLAINYYEMAYNINPNDLEIRNQILKLSRKRASLE